MAEETPPAPHVETAGLREVAPGVWVVPDRRVPLVPNIGIVLGAHTALVVDTGMGPANGEAVLAAARKLAGTRKLVLTLTHFHPEHGFGAQAFRGEAEIVYNAAQGADLAAKGKPYLAMFSGMGPGVAETLRGTRLVEADTLYAGPEHRLDLGGKTVLMKTWGMAHTGGDQVVFVEEDKVLFTGDLAEESTFPIFPWFPPGDVDIDPENWLRALEDCLALEPAVVVPGHGEVGGPEILAAVRGYIRDVQARVTAAGPKSEDELVAELAPQIRADHPGWHFPEWIDFAIRTFSAKR